MRRLPSRLTALGLVVAGAACSAAGATSPPSPSPDVTAPSLDATVVVDGHGVVAVTDGVARPAVEAVVGLDGSTVVAAEAGSLTWRAGVSGAVSARVGLVDDVVPIVTDLDGRFVALTPRSGPVAPGTIAPGRNETTIVVAGPSGEHHRVVLPGNFVPEAFSTELGTGRAPYVFLLEYLPAVAPTHYRVRVLDPVSGELSWPFNLRVKTESVDTEMAGISRDQVVATDLGLLFTLYRGHHAGEDTEYAFVHVLGMGGGVWCLAVPAELELAAVPGAVAVSPDESTLYVASANGSLATYDIAAVLDPERDPSATRVADGLPAGRGRPALAVTAQGVVLAQGGTVVWLDDELRVATEVEVGTTVTAIAAVPDGGVIAAVDAGLVEITPDGAGSAVVALTGGRVTSILPD